MLKFILVLFVALTAVKVARQAKPHHSLRERLGYLGRGVKGTHQNYSPRHC